MSEPLAVQIDGVPARAVSARDRGLHYGDGLFETLACVRGRVRFADRHWMRLSAGCARLGIRYEDWPALEEEVVRLAALHDRSIVKVIITRGDAVTRGYGPSGREQARRCVLQWAWPRDDDARFDTGVQVRTARLRLGENPALAGLKHLNRLEQVLARAELAGSDADEALLFAGSGTLVSGTMSNVFLVRDGMLETPRLDRCGVAGVMRAVVIERATASGLACREHVLDHDALAAADEIFLTNARIGIWPVLALDARELPAGPITRRLQALLAPSLEEPVNA